MHHARIAGKIRAQIERFSGNLSVGLPKVSARMVREVIYGMQCRGSVLLSEIARALAEPICLKKTIERLGRQLGRPGVRHQIQKNLLEHAAPKIGRDTLLILDPTDLSKSYAKKMQYLGRVRDGSAKELRDGYWCCQVIAASRASAEVIPLYQELYSSEAPDFVSENHQLLEAIQAVSKATEGRGVWVIDRGGDRGVLFKALLDENLEFLIRLRKDRTLRWRRQKLSVLEVAERVRLQHRETIAREDADSERVYELRFGATTVRLPGYEKRLHLVVIEGFGQEPLMLLTTLKVTRSHKSRWRIVHSYLTRWRVEETIRFIKQSYQLEDIRLLTYERLRTMATLVIAVAYFACVVLGKTAKLKLLAQHVLQAAQRIFGIPEFRFYALADGIKQLFYSSQAGLPTPRPKPSDPQIPLLQLSG